MREYIRVYYDTRQTTLATNLPNSSLIPWAGNLGVKRDSVYAGKMSSAGQQLTKYTIMEVEFQHGAAAHGHIFMMYKMHYLRR